MGKLGCSADGYLNDSKFSKPMPWIGIYVAAASALCALAMSIDAVHTFQYRKLRFPCKFFSLNATSLTLIVVAVKLMWISTPLCRDLKISLQNLAALRSSVLSWVISGINKGNKCSHTYVLLRNKAVKALKTNVFLKEHLQCFAKIHRPPLI